MVLKTCWPVISPKRWKTLGHRFKRIFGPTWERQKVRQTQARPGHTKGTGSIPRAGQEGGDDDTVSRWRVEVKEARLPGRMLSDSAQ